MVSTIKFSQFTSGGDLANADITVGYGNGGNLQFTNPWTFLAPGTTAQRPAPSPDIYNRLRFNTELFVYEYYDSNSASWQELSGSGTGTVNFGLQNNIAYYPFDGTAVSGLANSNNAVLVTDSGGVPSLQTTLPTGLSIPSATITSSTASLTSGQIAAAPVGGTDITNKTYVDSKFGSGVTSITGTLNQVIASSPTGAVTLSLPQDIATTSNVQFNSVQFNSNAALLDMLGNTILEFDPKPSSVNFITIGNSITGDNPNIRADGTDTDISLSILTKGNGQLGFYSEDTSGPIQFFTGTSNQHETNFNFANTANTRNVLWPDSDMTVAGTSLALGGTNNNLTASNGGIVWSDASKLNILSGTATANLPLLSGSAATPSWGSFSLSLGGALSTSGAHTLSGAFASTFTFTNTTSVTFPTSGTLATTSQIPTGAALTKTDDTNVTLTLGGSPTTALVNAASLTLGWTGQLGLTRGGTAASLTASNGGIVYSNASTLAILSGTSTAQQLLLSGASTTPQWSTTTYPLTNAINTIMYASSANVMGVITPAASSVLISSSGNVPSWSTTLPSGIAATNMNLTTPTLGVATATSLTFSPTTNGIVGTTTNDSASAGYVGEFVTSNASGVSITTTATAQNITSISLTAGDWDVWGGLQINPNGGSMTIILGCISITSATLSSSYNNILLQGTSLLTTGLAVPYQRISLSGTTTVYLVAQASFTVANPIAAAIINARRAR